MLKICLTVLFFLVSLVSQGIDQKGENVIEGVIYVDKNGDGVRGKNEKFLEGVVVSDGFTLVKSDKNGRFSICAAPKARFITVYTPSYYLHTTPFYLDVDGGEMMEFGLKSVENQCGKFLHLADIEERQYLNWQDDFKHFVGVFPVDFVAVTGDICYLNGLKLNSSTLNTEQVGARMVYTLGNHDLIRGHKDPLGNDYGEKVFEDCFGPVWYSFNVAGVHYMVTPMLSGDAKASYTPEDVFDWMKSDLSMIEKGMPVVIFNHDIMKNMMDLSDYNVIAYIYGHRHINYHYRDSESGIQYFCSVAPNKGGNDHSPSSFRIFTTSQGEISNQLHYAPIKKHLVSSSVVVSDSLEITAVSYDGESMVESVVLVAKGREIPLRAENDMLWRGRILLSGGENIHKYKVKAYFSDGGVRVSDVSNSKALVMQPILKGNGLLGSPVIDGRRLIVPVSDDQMSENCGIYGIDKNNGDVLWFYKTTGSVRNNIALYNGVVYAADVNSVLYAVDAASGNLKWKKECANTAPYPLYSQGVSISDGVIYMGQGSKICALRAEDGSVIWEDKGFKGGVTDVSTYVAGDGALMANSYWVGRFAIDIATGELLWEKRDRENRYSTSIPNFVDNHFIYTTSSDLCEIEPRSGVELKKVNHPHSFNTRSMPTLAVTDGGFAAADSYGSSDQSGIIDTLIIVGTSNHGMTAFKRSSFEQRWNYTINPALIYTSPYTKAYEQTIESSPVIYGDKVIFGGNDGYLYCVTVSKGSFVWRYNIGLPLLSNPVIDGEYIYILDFGGRVTKLSLKELQL